MLSRRTLITTLTGVALAVLPVAAASAAPVNDHRAQAVVLPAGGGSVNGTTTGATVTPDEEGERGSGTHSVWYRWTAPQKGRVTVAVAAPGFDAVMTAYAGVTTCCAWRRDDNTVGDDPKLEFDVHAGQTYDFAIDAATAAAHGGFTITATFTNAPPPPGNDSFATAKTLGSMLETVAVMDQHFATTEAGEPDHRGAGASRSLWYSWTPLAPGGVKLRTSSCTNSAYMTHAPVIAVYAGTSLATPKEVPYLKTDDVGGCAHDYVLFRAEAGVTYRIAVAASSAFVATASLQLHHDPVEPKITFSPGTTFGPSGVVPFQASSDTVKAWCTLDNGPTQVCTGGKYQLSNAAGGLHKLKVTAVDGHENVSNTETKEFKVDVTPPQTTILSGPDGPTNDTTADFTFGAEAGAKYECKVDAGAYLPCSSKFTAPERSHGSTSKLSVRATDPYGNTDPTAATRSWTVDTVAPQVALVGQPPQAPVGEPLTWAFATNDPAAAVSCSIDGAPFTPCSSPHTVPGAATNGRRYLHVRVEDAAGNATTAELVGRQFADGAETPGGETPTSPAGTPGATEAPGTTPPTGGPVTGTSSPAVRVLAVAAQPPSRRALARRGMTATATCTAVCTVTVELRVGGRVLARGSARSTARRATVALRPVRGAAKRIRRLRGGTRLTLTATVAGSRVTRVLKLAR